MRGAESDGGQRDTEVFPFPPTRLAFRSSPPSGVAKVDHEVVVGHQ